MFYRLFYFAHMKAGETMNNEIAKKGKGAGASEAHSCSMVKVTDARKHPVRGLWRRGSRYYAQLRFPGEPSARKIPLEIDGRPVRTVAEAIEARDRLKVSRRDGKPMTSRGRKPMLKEAVEHFVEHQRKLAEQEDARRLKLLARGEVNYSWPDDRPKPNTVVFQERLLGAWLKALGNVRVDRITRAAVVAHIKKMEAAGRAGSTINSHVTVLRVLLKSLADAGHLAPELLPTANIERRSVKTAPKEFLSGAGVAFLVETARRMGEAADLLGEDKPEPEDALRNGAMLADLVKLLALSGGRLSETLRLRWEDVDFDREEIRIGADGLSKNGKARNVPLNPELAEHLRDMNSRRLKDTDWLFPSPKRKEDEGCENWRNPHKAWEKLRECASKSEPGMSKAEKQQRARLRTVRLHDLRHHHASVAVMAGIDLPTVASFLGHSDGGTLVARTYGHLADDHRHRMAQRLVFSASAPERRLEDAKPAEVTAATVTAA
jgi:integrase